MTEPTVNRLENTDAFVVVDLPNAPTADGIVRCARKVLVDSTRSLARSRTYSWAILGQQISGASAAINAQGEGRDDAVAAFCAEVEPRVRAGTLSLAAGKGLDTAELEALGEVVHDDAEAFATGILACVTAARGSISGATVGIEFDGGAGEVLTRVLREAGADVVATGGTALETEAELLLFGSRAGVVDHEVAALLPHRLLVPTGAMAFTPRALAVAGRREVTVLPDFLTTAGPLAARVGMDPGQALGERASEIMSHDGGPVLGACFMAEEHLSTWCDQLPFGRPIG